MLVSLRDIWNLARQDETAVAQGQSRPLDELKAVRTNTALAYSILKKCKDIQDAMTVLEVARIELVKTFGTEIIRDGAPTGMHEVKRDSKNWPAFVAAIEERVADNVEIYGEPFALTDLRDATFSPAALEALSFLIAEEKPAKVTEIGKRRKKAA